MPNKVVLLSIIYTSCRIRRRRSGKRGAEDRRVGTPVWTPCPFFGLPFCNRAQTLSISDLFKLINAGNGRRKGAEEGGTDSGQKRVGHLCLRAPLCPFSLSPSYTWALFFFFFIIFTSICRLGGRIQDRRDGHPCQRGPLAL
jgi:hypothetical protein